MPAIPFSAKLAHFRALHSQPGLLLNNVWDGMSLRLAEECGAKAIATTSAGVAWSFGIADGHKITRAMVIAHARHLISLSDLPVSVDMEDGLLGPGEDMHVLARDLYDIGAVGLNIEDSADGKCLSISAAAERIRQLRAAAQKLDYPLFINARVDALLRGEGSDAESLIERALAYAAAGADGIFIPGLIDLQLCTQIAQAIKLPLNVLARANGPTAYELFAAGVTRVSAGSFMPESAYGVVRSLMREFQEHGRLRLDKENYLPYGEMNLLTGKGK